MIRCVDHVIHDLAADLSAENLPAMSVLVAKLRFHSITKLVRPKEIDGFDHG
jgi:hypothetical protein